MRSTADGWNCCWRTRVTAPHSGGVLVIDDGGDRKDRRTKSAHVGRQWLCRYGKSDNGVVTVTTL
jgi:SRSO17 transposase